MNSSKWSWDAMLVASVVIAAGLLAQPQHVAFADEVTEPAGRIVEITSDANTDLPKAGEATTADEQPAKPVYWIGIRGRVVDNPVLRTQFQLAEDLGVVIEEVVKDSPADKAGLRQHDIILRANDEPVQGMEDLAQLVTTSESTPIALQLIRLGKEETIEVVPEVRPEGLEQASTGLPGFGQVGGADGFGNLMGQIPGFQGMPQGGMRMFGPGIIVNGQRLDLNNLPNGVAVTVEKSGDGPAKITVKQGDKTWNIVGDDAKSLEQLPEELRGYVAQLLHGSMAGEMNFNWQKEMEQLLPNRLGQFMQAPVVPGAGAQQDPVLLRMDQLERQLRELQQQLQDSETAK